MSIPKENLENLCQCGHHSCQEICQLCAPCLLIFWSNNRTKHKSRTRSFISTEKNLEIKHMIKLGEKKIIKPFRKTSLSSKLKQNNQINIQKTSSYRSAFQSQIWQSRQIISKISLKPFKRKNSVIQKPRTSYKGLFPFISLRNSKNTIQRNDIQIDQPSYSNQQIMLLRY